MNKPVVQLEHAWKWKCPTCEASNVSDMVPAELTPDELAELEEQDCDGGWFTAPKVVTCLQCFEEHYAVAQ